MRLYYFIGRLLSPFAAVGLRAYSHLTHTPRARLVVQNENSELLLVKSWLSSGKWSLPGGGIDRGEAAQEAACRELKEETGALADPQDLHELFTLQSAGHDEVVFGLSLPADALPDLPLRQFEIQEVRWFSLGDLPRLETTAMKILKKVELSD